MATDTLRIITNNHPRELVSWHELPAGVAAEWFDYVTDEDERYSPRFVQYRGSWHDTSDCDGRAPQEAFPGWDLYQSDSFFSGIVFRWPYDDFGTHGRDYDYDRVIVGRYLA